MSVTVNSSAHEMDEEIGNLEARCDEVGLMADLLEPLIGRRVMITVGKKDFRTCYLAGINRDTDEILVRDLPPGQVVGNDPLDQDLTPNAAIPMPIEDCMFVYAVSD